LFHLFSVLPSRELLKFFLSQEGFQDLFDHYLIFLREFFSLLKLLKKFPVFKSPLGCFLGDSLNPIVPGDAQDVTLALVLHARNTLYGSLAPFGRDFFAFGVHLAIEGIRLAL